MTQISDITNTLTKFETVFAEDEGVDISRELTRKHLLQAIKILEAVEDYDTFLARLEIIDAVWAYYVGARNVGHTELMLHGVLGYDGTAGIIVGAEMERERFDNLEDRYIIPYNRFDKLVGQQIPVAWDNHAIVRIFSSLAMIQGAFRKVKQIMNGK